MMCLGWYNRPRCAAREQVEVSGPMDGGSGTNVSTSPCASAAWFWIAAAAILFTKAK